MIIRNVSGGPLRFGGFQQDIDKDGFRAPEQHKIETLANLDERTIDDKFRKHPIIQELVDEGKILIVSYDSALDSAVTQEEMDDAIAASSISFTPGDSGKALRVDTSGNVELDPTGLLVGPQGSGTEMGLVGAPGANLDFYIAAGEAGGEIYFGVSESGGHFSTTQAVAPFICQDSLKHEGASLAFYGAGLQTKPTVVGSRGGNAALASLISALASLGLLTDTSTP